MENGSEAGKEGKLTKLPRASSETHSVVQSYGMYSERHIEQSVGEEKMNLSVSSSLVCTGLKVVLENDQVSCISNQNLPSPLDSH